MGGSMTIHGAGFSARSGAGNNEQPPDTFEQSVLFTLMAQHLSNRAASASAAPAATSGSGGWGSTDRSSLA